MGEAAASFPPTVVTTLVLAGLDNHRQHLDPRYLGVADALGKDHPMGLGVASFSSAELLCRLFSAPDLPCSKVSGSLEICMVTQNVSVTGHHRSTCMII